MTPLVGVRRALLSRRPVVAAGGGGFTPASVTGLVLWVKADQLGLANNDPVATWADQSGLSHDLTAAGTARPTFKTGVLGGMPVVEFNGSTNVLKSAAFTLAQPEHVFVVFRTMTSQATNQRLSSGFNSNVLGEVFFANSVANDVSLYAGSVLTKAGGALTNTTWYLLAALFNGASSSIGTDGNAPTTGAGGSASMGGVTLGASGNSTQFANVQVAECCVYNAAVGAPDLASLVTYFARWGTLA